MRPHPLIAVAALAQFAFASLAHASDVWSGYDYAFSKTGGSDWTLEPNQDRITSNVWITRADVEGIFNIAQESDYTLALSPVDTLWSFGTTADIASLTFKEWRAAVNASPPASVGQNMVLYLVTDDVYVDIRFTSWGGPGSGGSFSYVRGVAVPAPGAVALAPLALLTLRRRR